MAKKEAPATQTFRFALEGQGQRIPLAPVEAHSLFDAVQLARKQCGRLALRGWEVVETQCGARYPAVAFYTDKGKKVFTNE